jgi:site-specific recombinase XerD
MAERLPAKIHRGLVANPAIAGPELSSDEAYYAERTRAANTRRGYRSDLSDFASWCHHERLTPLPAKPASVSRYLIWLAGHGTKVSTMSRRLSSIAYAHRFAGVPNPIDHPRVALVWEGIRREHAEGTHRSPPLTPPVLWDVLAALPTNLAGQRDRALLLIGFVGALRRSELADLNVEHVSAHRSGRVVAIPRSKTDPYAQGQLVVLPYATHPERCPVGALEAWLDAARITEGPVLRPVHRNGTTVTPRAMGEAAINRAVQRACRRVDPSADYSAHSLRAGFATYAAERGASDRSIAHQTRHRSLASLDAYIRIEDSWVNNAATTLDL